MICVLIVCYSYDLQKDLLQFSGYLTMRYQIINNINFKIINIKKKQLNGEMILNFILNNFKILSTI